MSQSNDPNRTVIGSPPSLDPNRTQAMGMPPSAHDPNRTQAIDPKLLNPGGKAVTAEVVPGRMATMANGPAREQFLIELKGFQEPGLPGMSVGTVRTPLNLCLVIDRSGSMQGEPLGYAKQACNHVVDLLSPQDVLSIVIFDDVVEVLMEPQRVTDKESVKAGIAQIQDAGATNLYDAMALGMQQLQAMKDGTRVTRMLVLTDGEPTAGITDFQSLVQHASGIRESGISSTLLGFGPYYNEELLATMAKRSGGDYYYIQSPQMIPEIFRKELEKLMTVSATNLSLELKLSRWVKLKSAGAAEVTGQNPVTLTLPDLERGATLSQVIDLEFPNHPLGHYRVAAGRLLYTDANSGSREAIDLDLIIEFTAESGRYSVPVNPRVAQASEISEASRAVERTIMGLKTQQINQTQAMHELQKTQALLLKDGRISEAQEVTQAMQALRSGDLGGAEKTLMGTVVHLDQGKKSGG